MYIDAPCSGKADVFIGPSDGKLHKSNIKHAQTICASCPFQRECLEDSLISGEYDVVRGGVYWNDRGMPVNLPSGFVFVRYCEECGEPIPQGSTSRRAYCGVACRRAAWENAGRRLTVIDSAA